MKWSVTVVLVVVLAIWTQSTTGFLLDWFKKPSSNTDTQTNTQTNTQTDGTQTSSSQTSTQTDGSQSSSSQTSVSQNGGSQTDGSQNGTQRAVAHCSDINDYNLLHRLIQQDHCWQVTAMFGHLNNIRTQSESCMERAIGDLADHFRRYHHTPHTCLCSGNEHYFNYAQSHDGLSDNWDCLKHQDFKRLYDEFFTHRHQGADPQCRTHHTIWDELDQLLHDSRTCLIDFIRHLESRFRNNDPCHCHYEAPTTTTTTTTTPAPTTPVPTTPASSQHTDPCLAIHSYNVLLDMEKNDECISANSVWHYLKDVDHHNGHCRRQLVSHLSQAYHNKSVICDCQQTGALHDERAPHMDGGHYAECRGVYHSTYDDIDNIFFLHLSHHGCQDQSVLWSRLAHVRYYQATHPDTDCARDMILRATMRYPDMKSDSCTCSKKTTTSQAPTTIPPSTTAAPTTSTAVPTTTTAAPVITAAPTTAAPTTAVPTTTSTIAPTTTSTAAPTTTTAAPVITTAPTTAAPTTTTAAPTTTPAPVITTTPPPTTTTTSGPSAYHCGESQTVLDMATAHQVMSSLAQPCALTGNDESLVLTECNMPVSSAWKRGINVLADCQSGAKTIPKYVPIATFSTALYESAGGHSAIFLGCSDTGFLAAVQYCGNSPIVVNLAASPNPSAYYTVV